MINPETATRSKVPFKHQDIHVDRAVDFDATLEIMRLSLMMINEER
jgi:hypothetical protein